MNRHGGRIKFWTSNAIALAIAASALAADRTAGQRERERARTTEQGREARRKVEWVFSLLPKSLQKDPVLDMTVFTEMTDAGRERAPATPDRPVYFESHSAGYRHFGEGAENRRRPEHAELEAALLQSLGQGGYRPAERPAHPPALALILHWGSHTKLDPITAEIDPNAALRNLQARATLVGGDAFASELMRAYEQQAEMLAGAGALLPEAMEFADPVRLFEERNPTVRYLVQQAHEDVYFVIASAYDYASMADGNKAVLLWRTRLTVNTWGVSMRQSLPPLILNASAHFGRETLEAIPISRRGLPEGSVEVGTPTVVEVIEPPATDPGSAERPANATE